MKFDINNFEDSIFDFVDQIKVLFSQDLWENILLNCTKNELFVLILLYRRTEVNMSAIADYLQVPLNTATGIVSRMEKKRMVERVRSASDKRVVTIRLQEEGLQQIKQIMKEYVHYGSKILASLTTEEIQLLNKLMEKTIHLVKNFSEEEEETPKQKVRKITIE